MRMILEILAIFQAVFDHVDRVPVNLELLDDVGSTVSGIEQCSDLQPFVLLPHRGIAYDADMQLI